MKFGYSLSRGSVIQSDSQFGRWRLLFLSVVVPGLLVLSFAGCSNSLETSGAIEGLELADNSDVAGAETDTNASSDVANTQGVSEKDDEASEEQKQDKAMNKSLKIATFGNGCYWCTEAVFQRVKGVKSVESGFSGGEVDNPTYEQVCLGITGHAEVLQIEYDPEVVSFEKLLEVFWKTHDPTTLNRQGNDIGTQYRSAVFYHDEEQKRLAEKYKVKLDESGAFEDPIVTEITEFERFYPAPKKHQNYYNDNKNHNPYCQMIQMKLAKFRKAFADVVDPEKDQIK